MLQTIILENLSFQKVDLIFEKRDIGNVFQFYQTHTLSETLTRARYTQLKKLFSQNDESILPLPLGESLFQLKKANDMRYKLFLNPHGDELFCRFRIPKSILSESCGVYCYFSNNELVYIGRSKDPFTKRVNLGYGVIHPKNCFLDGQSTNCHLNSLINQLSNVEFYVHPIDNLAEISETEKHLINKFNPIWNIQKC